MNESNVKVCERVCELVGLSLRSDAAGDWESEVGCYAMEAEQTTTATKH